MDPIDFYRYIAEAYNRPINPNPSIFEILLTPYAVDQHSWQGLKNAATFFEQQAALIEQQAVLIEQHQATIAQLLERMAAAETALGITPPAPPAA